MSKSDIDTELVITSMRKSVAKALDHKRRLGQYAIVSKDGKPTRLEADEIKPLAAAEDPASYNKN